MNKQIIIKQGDITTFEVDAIVNAANKSLLGGGGVDGAIHRGAGPELLEATKKLNGANTGEAKMTEGFRLPAKYVIHTVGPVYKDGNNEEPKLLKKCYKHSLELADNNNIESIAFPSISTGVYGCPKEAAAQIAIQTVQSVLPKLENVSKVIFVVFDETDKDIYEAILNS